MDNMLIVCAQNGDLKGCQTLITNGASEAGLILILWMKNATLLYIM